MTRVSLRRFVARVAQWTRRWSSAFGALALLTVASVAVAQHMGIAVRDAGGAGGAEVTTVTAGSPGARADLQPGDVILKVQGVAVKSAEQFTRAAHEARPGSTVTLRVVRQGWEKDVQLVAPAAQSGFGFTTANSPSGSGVMVVTVDAEGAGAAAGLSVGDRLVRLDGRAVGDARRLADAIQQSAEAGRRITLAVERGGWTKDVTLSPTPVQPIASASPTVAATDRAGELAGEVEAANRLYDAGRWREAEDAYRGVLASLPGDVRVLGRLCHVLVMQDRLTDAVQACRNAHRAAPREPSILQNLGFSLARLGNTEEAIASYQRAIDVAPEWLPPYAGLGAAYLSQRNWAKAEAAYRVVLTRDPTNREACAALASAVSEQGRTGEAIALYRKALELGPADLTLLAGLGWNLYREGHYGEARAAFVEANRLQPNDVPTLLSLGSVEQKLGDTAAARRAWQRAADLDPAGESGARARANLATLVPPSAPPASAPPRERVGVAPTTALPSGAPSAPPSIVPALGIEPMKAAIAVGDFQVKAANAGPYVGDGLREMLLTALHNSGRFVVLERMDLKGLAAEQALSRSRMARPGEAIPEGRMEVADLMVYGAVTEFEPEVRGGGFSLGMPNVPLTLGMQAKSAHMAVDVRLVDVASGRVLATGRILGEARATQATLGADIRTRGVTMPATLGAFQNTPMEQAIRECVEKAVAYAIANTPAAYFRRG